MMEEREFMDFYKETCVSLDIEATGLSPEKDRIIEIGVVKFQGEKVIDSFSTLINPETPVPYEVLSMTGIKESELKKAPQFDEVKDQLKKFVEDYPIVGHNITFDLDFLKHKGLKLKNPFYDTWHLSLMLLPSLSTYALESLARFLKIETIESHRALADAYTAKDIFLFLVKLIYRLDASLRKEIDLCLSKSPSHLKRLFLNIKIKKSSAPPSKIVKKPLKGKKIRIKKEQLKEILASQKVSRRFTGELQLDVNEERLLLVCLEAFLKKKFLLVKSSASLGFLMAAIYYSTAFYKKVILSYPYGEKDYLVKQLLFIQKFLPFDFDFFVWDDFYLCLKKFNNFKRKSKFTSEEARFLIKIILWLAENSKNYPTLAAEEKNLWKKFSREASDCLDQNCPFYHQCLFFQAKAKAQKAPLNLVHHEKFFQDMLSPSSEKFLPVFRDLIIFKTHLVEDKLHWAATTSFGQKEIESWLDNLVNILLVLESLSLPSEIKTEIADLKEKIDGLKEKLIIFWGIWGMFWQEKRKDPGEIYLEIDENKRFGKNWLKIKEATKGINFRLSFIAGLIESLCAKLKEARSEEFFILDLFAYQKELQKKNEWLINFVSLPYLPKELIFWASFKNEGANITLYQTKRQIKDLISQKLLPLKDSAIFIVPVTLAKFDYWRQDLGLENLPEVHLEKKIKEKLPTIYIVEKLPLPGDAGYKKALLNYLVEKIPQLKGDSFVLFTTEELLKDFYKKFLPYADQLAITCLASSYLGEEKIMEEIKKSQKEKHPLVVLGKVDLLNKLVGQNLLFNNLLITKLPFRFFPLPFQKARRKEFKDEFLAYALPRAIGEWQEILNNFRKIAAPEAAIYLLDKRIIDQDYGIGFLQSISAFNLVYQK